MAAFTLHTNSTTLSPTLNGSYNDVDLSSIISSGATGVLLQVTINGTSGAVTFGARKNGSTQIITYYLIGASGNSGYEYAQIAIGVDASRLIEIKGSDSNLEFKVIGEFGTGAVFFTDAVQKTITDGQVDMWTDIDCTTQFGADAGSVEAAIVTLQHTNAKTSDIAIRKNGSTDSSYFVLPSYAVSGGIVGVDSGDIFEVTANVDLGVELNLYLHGYIKTGQNVTMKTNAETITTSVDDAFTDVDITANTSSSAIGAFFIIVSNVNAVPTGPYIRSNGSTNAVPGEINGGESFNYGLYVFSACDVNRIVEYYRHDSSNTFKLIGYISSGASTYSTAQMLPYL